ncbi:hypothetical protein BDW02DRAFT_529368 [Decorospora gaudefroyi]|uniref:Utp8 beta-propeller domain-containing protein n=1 Tax=Decorospora gaudefroyi TaxID=184978 RepID=A0A6A5K5X1_9PLEO|nr:hypothetical protein BDW02DRAFT_529368 [Decorospora gaudefroyi]
MSSGQPIGAPFTLASLSKPIRSTSGHVHAAGVCSISGIKKRKRTEIAVGIDGEGVSIYSLQNPQLVTSYALPPSATLAGAPYSIYRKSSAKTLAHRFTYVSLAGSSPADRPQLVSFHDTTQGEHTETRKTSYTPTGPSHISTLDSLPVAPAGSANDATHDVLATFDNGDVVCLSADLETVRWAANLSTLLRSAEAEGELEHVSLASAKAVTRGLLRSRQDIATLVDPTPGETSDLLDLVQVLCVVRRTSTGARMLTLLQVSPRSADLTTNQNSPLKHLLTWDLPRPTTISKPQAASTHVALHASSGALHMLMDRVLLSYDFSGTVPKLYSELVVPGSNVDAFLRTSQDVLFTTSGSTCRVFDVKYNSLQALLSMGRSLSMSDSTSPSKKRKLAQPESNEPKTSPSSLIAYYPDIGLVVAARDDEIFGMQFGGATPRKRVKTEGTLLIDALGKGIASARKTHTGADDQKWQDRKRKLNKYAATGKIAKFEQAFAADLGIEVESPHLAQKHANEVNGGPLTNGGGPSLPDEDAMVIDKLDEQPAEDELRKWKIPNPVPEHQSQQYRQYALYALSKIFHRAEAGEAQDSSPGSLRVVFFPPNIFQWLLQTGHLTKESIHRSMLDETNGCTQPTTIVDGDIVRALVRYDLDLHILSAVLNHNQFLPVGEVVQAIKLLIQSIDDEPKDNKSTKLLMNGTAPSEPSEDDMDLDVDSELEAASHEIDHALSVLDHGLLTRSHALRPALIRLHTFSGPVISSTLRSMLPRRDLESLIRLLHLELKNGGWSSPLGFVDTESSEDPDDHAVAIIASLLSSTLDAIGAGAWLASIGTLSSSETSEDMLKSLNKDASTALSGFFEAHFIRGLLSEFLRYASTLPASQKPSSKSLELRGQPFAVTAKSGGEQHLPVLPLGAKADMGVEKMKSGKGGKKEVRSKREMGMLISKRVPKYSVERIVV